MKRSAQFFALLALALAPLPDLHAQAAAPNPAPPAAQPAIPPLEQKFRDGLYAEEATQDLDTAAKAYAEIIAAFDRDQATAASALIRLGKVHRKQYRPTGAIASFSRILQVFPDREALTHLGFLQAEFRGRAGRKRRTKCRWGGRIHGQGIRVR